MKDYSSYDVRKKEEISDEDHGYFKDYETLAKSSKWNSRGNENKNGNYKSNFSENVFFNLNYKNVINFQKKSFQKN